MDRPYVVAECGINANCDINIAYDMISAAKEAGCSSVKFQMYFAEDCTDKVKPEFKVMLAKNQWEMEDWEAIAKCANDCHIDWFASVFSKRSLEVIQQFNPCRWKTAAPDFVVGTYWGTKVPNPRWASYDPRYEALIRGYAPYWYSMSGAEVTFFCVSDYPACAMGYPSDIDRSIFKGLSDHTPESQPPHFGFMYYEKHFTLDRKMEGPDHFFALEPAMMKEYVSKIQEEFCGSDDERLLSYVGRFR